MVITGSNSCVGIYAWCNDFGQTPGGIEAFVWNLAPLLVERGVAVVVHNLAADTAGWHVHDGQFRIGGQILEGPRGMRLYRPAHGPGVSGAIAEHVAVSAQLDESVVLAIGTRDDYVFNIAAAVAEIRQLPAAAAYFHTADERRFRAQFTTRGAGVSGLADASEKAAFEQRALTAIRGIGERFDAVVVPTEYVRAQVAEVLAPRDRSKIAVAYHGVDDAVFFPCAEPWDGRGPWLHVSRFSVPNAAHKNFTWSCELVKAAAASGTPLQHCRLELCGGGNAERLFDQFARQNGLEHRIGVVGSIDQPALAQRYRRASFLLVPSMMEAGATVIVEAVLSGCVPVVMDFAGSGEIMRRLGLADLLLRPFPRRHGVRYPDGTPAGGIDTVEPNVGEAIAVMTRAVDDPGTTNKALRAAAAIARAEFTIRPCLSALDSGLRRLGVDLGMGREPG